MTDGQHNGVEKKFEKKEKGTSAVQKKE